MREIQSISRINKLTDYSITYGLIASKIAFMFSSAWIFKLIGLDKSKLKIPMMDLASMTYLPETKSKSLLNFEISFTKDFTLSIEFNEIKTVFIFITGLLNELRLYKLILT